MPAAVRAMNEGHTCVSLQHTDCCWLPCSAEFTLCTHAELLTRSYMHAVAWSTGAVGYMHGLCMSLRWSLVRRLTQHEVSGLLVCRTCVMCNCPVHNTASFSASDRHKPGPAAPSGVDPTAAGSPSVQLGVPPLCDHDGHTDAEPPRVASESSTHAFEADPRNEDMLVGIRDGLTRRLVFQWRPAAKVSALDAGFLLGDGVWEGLRIHKGCVLFAWVRSLGLCRHPFSFIALPRGPCFSIAGRLHNPAGKQICGCKPQSRSHGEPLVAMSGCRTQAQLSHMILQVHVQHGISCPSLATSTCCLSTSSPPQTACARGLVSLCCIRCACGSACRRCHPARAPFPGAEPFCSAMCTNHQRRQSRWRPAGASAIPLQELVGPSPCSCTCCDVL